MVSLMETKVLVEVEEVQTGEGLSEDVGDVVAGSTLVKFTLLFVISSWIEWYFTQICLTCGCHIWSSARWLVASLLQCI